MFVHGFDPTLHSFYTVLRPTCSPYVAMFFGTVRFNGRFLLEREDPPPVFPHVRDCPATLVGFGECDFEASHRRDAVVVLARGVGMVDEHHQPTPGTGGSPLQHLQVAVGVAKGGDRPLTDKLLDGGRLALFVVKEVETPADGR